MSIEITGTLKAIEPYVQISEKFGKAGAVFTMQNGQYENELYIEFHGKSADLIDTMEVGQEYTVGINLSSREWNGKYFTTAKGWKVTPAGATAPAPKAPPAPLPPASFDDLPF